MVGCADSIAHEKVSEVGRSSPPSMSRNNGCVRSCYATASRVNVRTREGCSRNMTIDLERTVDRRADSDGRSPPGVALFRPPNRTQSLFPECRKCRTARDQASRRSHGRTTKRRASFFVSLLFFLSTYGFHIRPCATNPPWFLRDSD